MKIQFSPQSELSKQSIDLLVVPLWQGEKGGVLDSLFLEAHPTLGTVLADIKGKEGSTQLFYPEKGSWKRILLIGCGKKEQCTLETLRRAYALGVKCAKGKSIASLSVVLPEVCSNFEESACVKAVLEGILHYNYEFSFKEQKELKTKLQEVTLYGVTQELLKSHLLQALIEELTALFSSVYFARDLVNTNADDLYPEKLGQIAQGLEREYPELKVTVFDKKRIEQEGMGLLLAVNRGSFREPRFLIVEYKGAPSSEPPIILVGKGVTYDTGGLSLKPTTSMLTMKCDMAGAAAVLATMRAAASLKIKRNIIALIPSTENGIDAMSYKLGDVYKSYDKKSVEITNTDAEGRLILADALAYAKTHYKPSCIIDLATLTGGVIVALGNDIAGVFSKDHSLKSAVKHASEVTGERVWELPLADEYKDALKSEIADLKNATSGREASSITAALFLQEFVGNLPWLHLDIAGPAFYEKPKGYYSSQATGFGVRLLIEFFKSYKIHE